jgi:hypothetical protein
VLQRLWAHHRGELLFFIMGLIAVHLALFSGTFGPGFRNKLDSTKASEFGQFVGGYVGTIFVIASVALLIASFRNQRAASELSAFENRFFELLKYHRENASEIEIGQRTGRKVFISLVQEFRETLDVVQECCRHVKLEYPQAKQIDLAYTAFYYGVGRNSSRVLRAALADTHPSNLVESVVATMEHVQTDYRQGAANLKALAGRTALSNQVRSQLGSLTRLSYCPFDGHQSRLGHYYRHMYQLVKYAAKHTPPPSSVIDYVDLLRAQLTNHEQALLCLNSLSKIGSAWGQKGYITDYGLIKNIPKNFFNPETELNLPALFSGIQFEYDSVDRDEPNRD